ncbi:aldehyde dehydrogenase family protein [Nocardia pseudobrasiliensis]|uniref:Succinate-semialdehyde dehydrogenase/glutarate-semialdehyde dehydrogenase n=1 Tax=Nocardia pseudobrasiliensis TaxID=45979 RepID=A0A370IC08_9NOCA|nr:aldehyde dehydrogenase family protein [Nocardia pseudobrasiliensis]RDI68140.1 succinate-semialdehyde dehydrogenase/glutarate-semialdehyde dehydrogenase [Nocardia pseudobrasiliensis]
MTADALDSAIKSPSTDIYSYGSYIAGENIYSGKWVHVLDPRSLLDDSFASLTLKRRLDSGELSLHDLDGDAVIGRVAVADDDAVAASLSCAAAAAREWRSAPLSLRIDDFLERMHSLLTENAENIEHLLTLEGHPRDLAKWEISGMLNSCRVESRDYFREQLWREFSVDGRRHIVRRQPDGVVCLNPPANAPMTSALMGGLILAAGNAVVIRAPRSGPLGVMYAVNNLLGPTLAEVGAPAGVLNAVCGDPGPLLKAWLDSPHVDDIMYFGSSKNGIAFERRCVEAGKKPILELAGNDTVVVWKDADPEYAAQALIEGFYGSGQLCMIPNQVIAHPEIAEELLERLVAAAGTLRTGYPDESGVLLSPVLRNDGFYACLRDATDKGATVLTGGRGLAVDGTEDPAGFFLEPTVIRVDGLDRSRELDAVRHETFFPLLPVVVPEPTDDRKLLDAIIDFVNSNLYGLRNSVWASDPEVIDQLLANVVNGGLLKINESHISFAAALPSHGGTGLTGGVYGEANYPTLRTTHIQGVAISDGRTPPKYR